MTAWRLIRRGLVHHWRTHLTVLAGTALCTAVITGALVVGDSVRASLHALALQRLGRIDSAVVARNGLVRAALADDLGAVPVLLLPGTAASSDGERHANDLRIVGIDARFGALAPGGSMPAPAPGAILNRPLAAALGATVGDDIVLRLTPPGRLSSEVAFASADDSVAFRLPVTAIVGSAEFGDFSLAASQVISPAAFVALDLLQERAAQPGRANLILSAKPITDLPAYWQPEDVGVYHVGDQLRHRHVFIPEPILAAIGRAAPHGEPVLTYFVNDLAIGDRHCPYSLVAGTGAGAVGVNQWLADDLAAKVGDTLTLRYFLPDAGPRLREDTASFTVAEIFPTRDERQLMPDFPGLSAPESCRDWDTSLPVDLSRIRPQDEQYWEQYHGTPKVTIPLAAAQRLWGSRFGRATAVVAPDFLAKPDWPARLMAELTEWDAGVGVVPVRHRALTAARSGTDFGMLFISLSFFLIVAALALTGLLFGFGVHQRQTEIGLLLALGFTPRRVRRLFLAEGAILAVGGAVVGLPAGIAYTAAVLTGLRGTWGSAIGQSPLVFHAAAGTLATGAVAGIVAALVAIVVALWGVGRRPVRALLAETPPDLGKPPSPRRWWLPTALGLAAVILVGAMFVARQLQSAGMFFGLGALLLLAVLAALWTFLRRPGRPLAAAPGLGRLARRNLSRHPVRALSTAGALACGAFLVVAVGAFRRDAAANAADRHAGTGGFAFYAESALPITRDLNDPAAREFYGLDAELLADVHFVPCRRRAGDDASCLNLNRAQQPVVLGVDPAALAGRFRFVTGANGWQVLSGDGLPAVTDNNTITYALGETIGGTVPYPPDRGRPVRLLLAGGLADSILQGRLVIASDDFQRLFPSVSGWQVFLIDCPLAKRDAVRNALTKTFAREGLTVQPAVDRLAAFLAVENTYIGIFQALGGLGLILGSIGLAVVLLRHALERRRELAVLRALGFSRGALGLLLMLEHWLLLLLGVAGGAVAGLVAVLPLLRLHGAQPPWGTLGLTLLGILGVGMLAVGLAAWLALRGRLLPALRSE